MRKSPPPPQAPVLPEHVAFIMDGNGRWAKERNLPRTAGHKAGAETVRRVVRHARKRGIRHLTLYAFSTENWARPAAEVAALMRLLGAFVKGELRTMLDNGVKLAIIGDQSALSAALRRQLAAAVAATADCAALTLTLALNYGGRDEIVRAARAAMRRLNALGQPPEALDAGLLASCLDDGGTPEPDLVVRTAGEMRLSNFLIWQAAYAELYFTERRWPDFDEADFDAALAEFAKRVRKFGGLTDS